MKIALFLLILSFLYIINVYRKKRLKRELFKKVKNANNELAHRFPSLKDKNLTVAYNYIIKNIDSNSIWFKLPEFRSYTWRGGGGDL